MILHDYHRDIDSEITLETNAVISGIDPKTWGFLIYPEGDDEEETTFEDLMTRVLVKGTLPLTGHYIQGYFLPHGPAHQAYCLLLKDFVKEQLNKYADPW
jgi:hypothetical protein